MNHKKSSKLSLQHILYSKYSAPVILVLIPCLAYGFLIPSLGFYWDDWPVVFLAKAGGNFWQYYLPDRPLFAWPDLAFLTLAGVNPVTWQVLSLLTRIATVFCFWWMLTLIWPKRRMQNFSIALLFAIYPVFLSQSMAITYKTHFICLALFLLSLALMILATRKPRYFILFFLASLLLDVFQMATLEYFWGLEFVRPVIIWMVINHQEITWRQKLRRTLLLWIPFLLALGSILVWRFAILKMVDDRNAPALFTSLIRSPLSTSTRLFLVILRDSAYLLIGNWLQLFNVQSLDGITPTRLFSWGLAVASGSLIWIYLSRGFRKDEGDPDSLDVWPNQAMGLGLLALVTGMLPVWMTNRLVTVGTYSDRYAISALVGASLLIGGLINLLIVKSSFRAAILALLVGLSTGFHFRTANEYRWDWTYQKNFYWQLYWRAPGIKPRTSILSEGGLFKYTTKYSLATAINSLYPTSGETAIVPYWTFELDDNPVPDVEVGSTYSARVRTITFSAPAANSLVILNERGSNHCLLVLSRIDKYYPRLPSNTHGALAVSDLSQILPNPVDDSIPDPNIFGSEPEHTWCYFFEKADLARQEGDWAKVIDLGNQATSLGLYPSSNYEWFPFIEAYIHVGDLEKAQILTLDINRWDPKNRGALCAIWQRLTSEITEDLPKEDILLPIEEQLECSIP